MLNPSTADAFQDDPTIRKCIGFAKRWGMNRVTVVNLFAYRATKPANLKKAFSPWGTFNDKHIVKWAKEADLVVCAWGTHGSHIERDKEVRYLLRKSKIKAKCLGRTKDGSPRHPLMVAYSTELEDYV